VHGKAAGSASLRNPRNAPPFAGPSGVCSRASCAAHGAFLAGGLEPGASWSRVVQFNVAWAGLASLQVLLCYHSGPSGVPCAALLHTMQLDELCFLVAGTAAAQQPWRAPWQQQPALAAGAAAAECKMLLQVPRVVLDPPPAPGSVLRALLQLGQASAEDEHEAWPPADGAIDLHPSTAFAPPPARPASSGHGPALAWTGTRPASMRSADFPAGGVELGLDALPAASQRGSAMAGFTAFSVATRGRDTASALHAHAALADRALMAQALSCRAWLQVRAFMQQRGQRALRGPGFSGWQEACAVGAAPHTRALWLAIACPVPNALPPPHHRTCHRARNQRPTLPKPLRRHPGPAALPRPLTSPAWSLRWARCAAPWPALSSCSARRTPCWAPHLACPSRQGWAYP
jgi:hypothetical protein